MFGDSVLNEFTNYSPNKDGYYWFATNRGIHLVKIIEGAAFFLGDECPKDPEKMKGTWAGPIVPPRRPNGRRSRD